jgi:hypothetical protein
MTQEPKRDRPATKREEMEVTEEMASAGAEVLAEFSLPDSNEWREAAIAVYLRMKDIEIRTLAKKF